MDWETRYQTGDTPWEKGEAAPPLVEWLARNEIDGRILVPGCGSGHDVRALARAGADPVGIDIAPSAIQRAAALPRAGEEVYEVADLFALPEHLTGIFDWVFEHTCFCAIDPLRRADYVAGVMTALKPGGHLLAIFYINPGHDGDGPPFGVSEEEIELLFEGMFERVTSYVPTIAYPGREGRELLCLLRRRS
jgi:SAM-dependent methyltransferase